MAIANMQVQFDNLFMLFTYLAIAVGIVVFSMMIYFIIRYRERSNSEEPHDAPILGRLPIPRGHARSVVITLTLSSVIVGALVVGSFATIDTILSTPPPCTDIQIAQGPNPPVVYNCSVLVTGHRFYWDFTYPGYPNKTITGTASCQEAKCLFAIPVGHDIRLNVTSADVFHNFGVIAFKVKADAYPGHINNIWFNADTLGNYTIQCYELCGAGHATMIATLDVMTVNQFVLWYNSTIVH